MSTILDIGYLVMASGAQAHRDFPTIGETLMYLAGIVFFLLMNAFFVASEFAIVKVRPSQIETAGKLRGKPYLVAERVVSRLDGYLSANQLGITIASLFLGALGEPFVGALVGPILFSFGMSEFWVKWISYAIAMGSFTFLHVVISELIPKSIAIQKPLQTTLMLSKPLHAFYVGLGWAIWIFNSSANFILRTVFKMDPAGEGEVHSSEELALLVQESGESEEVTKTEKEILINALELNDVSVKEVMLPRSEVVALDIERSFEDNLALAVRTKHTRFPLVRGHFDSTLGLIHIKDILKLVREEAPDLMKIKRELKVVPETMPLDGLLEFFLREKGHLAMVVDEFGDSAGLVFMDNIMEELVGDIQDEFDNEETGYTQVNDEEYVVEGSFSVNDLESMLGDFDLDVSEVTTIGGYITQQLERLPEPGETVRIDGYEAKVISTDGRRVGQVHLRRLSEMERAEGEIDAA